MKALRKYHIVSHEGLAHARIHVSLGRMVSWNQLYMNTEGHYWKNCIITYWNNGLILQACNTKAQSKIKPGWGCGSADRLLA